MPFTVQHGDISSAIRAATIAGRGAGEFKRRAAGRALREQYDTQSIREATLAETSRSNQIQEALNTAKVMETMRKNQEGEAARAAKQKAVDEQYRQVNAVHLEKLALSQKKFEESQSNADRDFDFKLRAHEELKRKGVAVDERSLREYKRKYRADSVASRKAIFGVLETTRKSLMVQKLDMRGRPAGFEAPNEINTAAHRGVKNADGVAIETPDYDRIRDYENIVRTQNELNRNMIDLLAEEEQEKSAEKAAVPGSPASRAPQQTAARPRQAPAPAAYFFRDQSGSIRQYSGRPPSGLVPTVGTMQHDNPVYVMEGTFGKTADESAAIRITPKVIAEMKRAFPNDPQGALRFLTNQGYWVKEQAGI